MTHILKRKGETQRHTEDINIKSETKTGNYAATGQIAPRDITNWRIKERLQRKHDPTNTLVSDFWPPEL